jgi:hypothetical protein
MTARWNSEVRVKVANKRAQMWTNMRAWLERGTIPDDQQIADDLTGLEYSYTADNAILLEKKEHMKARGLASPDHADALGADLRRGRRAAGAAGISQSGQLWAWA